MALCMKHPGCAAAREDRGGPGDRLCRESGGLDPGLDSLLGHLDDALIIPLGVRLVRRMIPDAVWDECRRRAERSRR